MCFVFRSVLIVIYFFDKEAERGSNKRNVCIYG